MVKGIVRDASGPLPGVHVVEKGTTNGTVTDIDGNFSLKAAPNSVLAFSFIGYNSVEVPVNGRDHLSVVMAEISRDLEEAVVIGYGTQRKSDLTGSVVSVRMDDVLGSRPLTQAVEALQGTVPGLFVSSGGNAPGTSKSFQIRNAYSVSNGVIGPLVLIDGVAGDLSLVNPDDIESVTTLKDAASAAIYGARASGGVILVTTKHPKGEAGFHVAYSNNFAFATAVNLPEQAPLDHYLRAYADCCGDQFWSMNSPSVSRWLRYLEEYRKDPASFKVFGDGIYKDEAGGIYYLNEKDLYENMFETSFQQTHNLSLAGVTDKIRYRLSTGYTDTDGVLITDKDMYRRLNIRAFVSADVTKWFRQEATLSYSHSKKTLPSSPAGGIYSTRLVSFYPEGAMPEEIDEESAGLPFFTPANQIRWSNPARTLNDNPRIFLASVLKPLKGLEITFEYTFDKKLYDYSWYTGSIPYTTIQGSAQKTPDNDYLDKVKRYTDYNSVNLYGNYSFALKDHKFRIMAGFNQESSYQEQMEAVSYGQAVVEVPSLGGGTSTLEARDSYSAYAIRSGFFRVNYNFADRYLLGVSGRYDGSSKFPKDSRFGFFPAVSAAWNMTNEKFMENARSWLGQLKLRVSYGMIGNQNIAPYLFVPTMSVDNKYNGWLSDGEYVTAISTIPGLVSSDFTWEKVGTVNIGVDFTLLKNRLSGTFECYQKNTTGMLAPGMPLPGVIGADAPYQNTSDMRTRGWELSMNWNDRIGEDFSYKIGFNLYDSFSKITKYVSNSSCLLGQPYKGQKLGEIWGYLADGFYETDDFVDTYSWILKDGVAAIDGYNPRPGDLKFRNLMDDEHGTNLITNGDNTLTNPGDRKIIGNSTPRYIYGVNLGLNYKKIALSAILQGTGRRDAWIASTLNFPLYADFKFVPLYEGLEDYWKPADAAAGDFTAANPDARFPRIYGDYGNQGSNYRTSDRYLSDASYFRIKNVTLSYLFSKKWMDRFSLSQAKAFVSVENLAVFSSLPKGIDPETLNWNYPSYRTVSLGFSVTF